MDFSDTFLLPQLFILKQPALTWKSYPKGVCDTGTDGWMATEFYNFPYTVTHSTQVQKQQVEETKCCFALSLPSAISWKYSQQPTQPLVYSNSSRGLAVVGCGWYSPPSLRPGATSCRKQAQNKSALSFLHTSHPSTPMALHFLFTCPQPCSFLNLGCPF